MAKKLYAVRTGRTPGIYETWEACKAMVHGFPGAEFKSFSTREEAEAFIGAGEPVEIQEDEETVIAYVDGSFSNEKKRYAYGCVILCDGMEETYSGAGNDEKYLGMRNVAGEILGSMEAIRWALRHGKKRIRIFYDYAGIEKWANGEWKANKVGTQEYQAFIAESRKKLEIVFTKVAAHTGVELNEKADQLAKGALGLN